MGRASGKGQIRPQTEHKGQEQRTGEFHTILLMNGVKPWAIVGTLLLLVLSASGWLYTDLSARISILKTTDSDHGERLARLEEQFKYIKESLDRIERQGIISGSRRDRDVPR